MQGSNLPGPTLKLGLERYTSDSEFSHLLRLRVEGGYGLGVARAS